MSSLGGYNAITVYQVGDDVEPPAPTPPAPTPDIDGDYGELGCAADQTDGTRVRDSNELHAHGRAIDRAIHPLVIFTKTTYNRPPLHLFVHAGATYNVVS